MNLREKILKSSFKAGACHIGSALSCVEIVESIYEVKKPEDIFLFAKASGVATLYCYLHPVEKAWKYLKKYPLPSNKVPGVIWSGGSCGTGLSVAVGIALAKKKEKKTGKVYCLISDGELNEGQVWEAIAFSAHHKLDNLVVVVDKNGYQSLGKTEDIIDLSNLYEIIDNFGWKVVECDGHNKEDLKDFMKIQIEKKPLMIIANTIKGNGVDFMEDSNLWHYKNLDLQGFKSAILQVADKKGK